MNVETFRIFSNVSGWLRILLLLTTLCLPLCAAPLETLSIQSGESRSLDLPLADPGAGALLWVRGRVVLPEGEAPGAHSLHLVLNGTPLTPENTRVLNKRSVFDLPGKIVDDPNRQGRQIIESPEAVALFDAGAGGWYLKADADAFPFNLEGEPGDPYTSMGGGLPAVVPRPNLTAKVLQNLGAVVSHYYEYLFELPEERVREANTLIASVRLPDRLAAHAVALSAGWMPAPDGVVTYHRPTVDEFTLVRQAPSLSDVVGPERGLRLSACAGESEPVSVTLYTLDRLENVTIGVEFSETDASGEAGKLLDSAQAYFLAQRLPHQQSKSRLPFSRDDEPDGVAPDILVRQGEKPVAAGHPVSIPFQYYRDRKDAEKIETVLARSRELEKTPGIEILAGTSQRFLVDFRIPKDLSPGEYPGMITLRSGEQTLRRIPLELTLRPFALAAPRQKYWMWRQTWLPITEQGSIDALNLIADMGIHGICRLAGMGIGMKVDKDSGEFLFDDTQLRAGKEILEEAGLSLNYAHDLVSGPFHWVCRYKYGIRPGNARWFGYKFLPELADTPLNPDDYNPGSRDPDDEELARLREKIPEIKKDVIALLKRMRAVYEEVGLDPWTFPYDEPDGTDWAHPWVKFSAEVAHAAGFKVWSSHNDPMGWPSGIDMSVAGGLYWHVPNRIHKETIQGRMPYRGVPILGRLKGQLDEIWVYNRTLTDEEMLRQHREPAQDRLLAYYPLDEGEGVSVADAQGNAAFDLTLSGGKHVRWVDGRQGKALEFDYFNAGESGDGSEPVAVALSPSDNMLSGDRAIPGEDWSISLWYRGRGTLFEMPGNTLRLYTTRHGPKADFRTSSPGEDATERVVLPGERGIQPDDRFWNHVTLSVNGREGVVKFYLHNEEQRQWYRENITWNYSQYRGFNPMLCRVQAGNTTWHAKELEHMTVFVFDLNYGIANLAWPEGGERMFNRPDTRWYPGLGLLAMREGIDDARYANTLFKRLRTRMDDEAAWETVARLYPGREVLWQRIYFQPALEGLSYNDIRARLAREISTFPKTVADMPDGREANPVDSGRPLSGAEAYYQGVPRVMDAIEAMTSDLARSAAAAAGRYVGDETLRLGVDGSECFVREATYRSGGLIQVDRPNRMEKDSWKGIVLYALREGQAEQDRMRLADYSRRGCPLVVFGTQHNLEGLALSPMKLLGKVVIPAGVKNQQKTRPEGVPTKTDPLALMATLWPWVGEYVAACTRQGRMPPMYQSIRIPEGRARNDGLKEVRFHKEAPQPVDAGVLTGAYMQAVRDRLDRLWRREGETIRKIARIAVERKAAGGRLFMVGGAHGGAHIAEGTDDPGLFTDITQTWREQHRRDFPSDKPKIEFKPDDLLLVVGYDYVPNEGGWHNLVEKARQGGAMTVLCIATFREDQMTQVEDSDILLPMPWELGDAEVDLPGYDVNILPSSNVLAAAIYGMINAEVLSMTLPQP